MKNKILQLLSLSIIFTSCRNENQQKHNVNIEQKTNLNDEYKEKNEVISYQNLSNLNNPAYISGSNNYPSYEAEEAIKKLQQENQRIYEEQMKEMDKMKVGLNDFYSPKYKELEDDKRLREIMAETDRITKELNDIDKFKTYERPYVPDPIILPNSNNYSNDYVNPNANPIKVDVSGYQKSNGTYVNPHIRTAPNERINDNLRYPY